MGLRLELDRFTDALTGIFSVTLANIEEGGQAVAAGMEADAKANAPWTDRTGNARRTLAGFVDAEKERVNIGIMGRMSYSPQLELGYGGRYAVLVPTLEAWIPDMVEMIRGAVAAGGGLSIG